MSHFPVPNDEPARLAELLDLSILDTLPEQHYDDIVRLAARLCDMPIAVVNFIDAERQWGKALVGLESSEGPREDSFCAHTIAAEDGVLVVADTHLDRRFVHNPHVIGDPRLRSYAGVAIVSPRGHALGAVCVADREPRKLDPAVLTDLQTLARQAAALLELRLVTQRLIEANTTLGNLAMRDELTGLPNRRLAHELLERLLAGHRRSGRTLGVVFADVDRLKAVNDEHGHAGGDFLLRTVGARLHRAARAADTVARVSGDEFLIVCPDLGHPEDVRRAARRLSLAVSVPVRIGDATVTPRVTVGTAVACEADDVAGLVSRADEAMYSAKPLN